MSPRFAAALVSLFASCSWGCEFFNAGQPPGPITPESVAVYQAALEGCDHAATSKDAGLACLRAVKSGVCGDGGPWGHLDAGECSGPIGGH